MRKLLLGFILIFSFIIGGCSCDKFDIKTYESAVKNYKNSTGFEYRLTVTTKVENQNYYIREEIKNKFILKTTGEIYDFSSEQKSYQIMTPDNAPESAPSLIHTLNRYYRGEQNKFYTQEITNYREIKNVESISYENKYNDINSEYNFLNIVPVFSINDISQFKISDMSSKNGYSSASFVAPVLSCFESDVETISYEVTMNKNFYFHTIKYTIVSDDTTTTYEYEFLNYNSKVDIKFPADLANY